MLRKKNIVNYSDDNESNASDDDLISMETTSTVDEINSTSENEESNNLKINSRKQMKPKTSEENLQQRQQRLIKKFKIPKISTKKQKSDDENENETTTLQSKQPRANKNKKMIVETNTIYNGTKVDGRRKSKKQIPIVDKIQDNVSC